MLAFAWRSERSADRDAATFALYAERTQRKRSPPRITIEVEMQQVASCSDARPERCAHGNVLKMMAVIGNT